jgi:hypothetical protein
MQRRIRPAVTAALVAAVAPAMVSLAAVDGPTDTRSTQTRDEAPVSFLTKAQSDAIAAFRADNPLAGLIHDETGLIDRIYGVRIAEGATPEAAAAAAIDATVDILGAPARDFVAGEPVGMMHDPATGEPKFFLYRFQQQAGGVDVFRSTVGVLVRNAPDFPVAWVGSDAKPIAGFRPAPGLRNAEVPADIRRVIEADAAPGTQTRYSEVRGVVFAGHENRAMAPVDAVTFVAEIGTLLEPDTYFKNRYVVDANTGAVLHEEPLVHRISLEGTVAGRATVGVGGMDCEIEELQGMPYARVLIDGAAVFADVNGDWTFDSPTGGPFDVQSELVGRYFRVNNEGGPNAGFNTTANGGDVVDFVFNDANASEIQRAEVNAYLEANRIRDWVLALQPEYPVIATQTDFDINVNIANSCNAFYNGSSINFYTSGGGCQNTAFASVVYHEYGHHLVNVGGSGQGEYGEGMSDTVSALLLDDPRLGVGFFTSCSSPLRNADNDCQYQTSGCSSCGSAIHSCGQLISGAVWDTRQALQSTLGDAALAYVSQLTVNSIILHTGTSIDPAITVDFLVLDDDDDTIANGTPNYAEISAGFGLHNMPGPALSLVAFQLPSGVPAGISPSGGDTISVEIQPVTDTPVPGTGVMKVVVDGGVMTMPLVASGVENQYFATFPATECGSAVDFFFEVQSEGGDIVRFPDGFDTLTTFSAESVEIAFADDFETNQGWVVTNTGGLTDGAWTRGIPVGGGVRGDPPADADGSGRAFVTDNVAGNSDVDGGSTLLTSPVMSPAAEGSIISYNRWYSNTFGAAPNADIFEVEISDNGGSTWTTLEVVGPGGPEVDGGWFYKQFDLSAIAGFELNDQFRIRFTASDLGDGSVIEAGVDGVELLNVDCTPTSVPGDVDGDGVVDFNDLLAVLSAFGPCAGCPADLDGNGAVDFTDLLELLSLL